MKNLILHEKVGFHRVVLRALMLILSSVFLAGPAAAQTTVTFDFDTDLPVLTPGQNVPLDQDTGGVIAHFSAASGAFSVQDGPSTSLLLSDFSGNYLYPNGADGVLVIQFSQLLTNLVMDFATAEQNPIEFPTPIKLIAYTNSTSSPAVGSAIKAGKYFGVNTLPMGKITFDSVVPFNIVTINIQPGGATGFLIDNLVANVSGGNYYTITTSASPSIGGSASGGGTFLAGASVTLTATPNPGFIFANWTENGIEVSNQPSLQFPADSFRTLVANFLATRSITTVASPAAGGVVTGDSIYSEGSVATVTATANPGYAFVNWTENGAPVSTWTSYLFTVSTDRALVANFASAYTIATSVSSAGGGFSSGDGIYAAGTSVAVTATPRTGYSFVNWTDNGQPASSSPNYIFTATADRSLVANFAQNPSGATFDFDTGSPVLTNGQITPFDQTSGGVTAHFTSTNDPAFSVESVAGTSWILSRFAGNCLAPIVLDSVLDIRFDQSVTNISLVFATLDFQDILAPTSIELTAYTNSTSTPAVGSAVAKGSLIPGNSMPMGLVSFSSVTPFNLVRIKIVPTTAGATDFLVDDISVQAVGSQGYTIAASSNPPGGGTVSGSGIYGNGEAVTLVATANPGFAFQNWTEDGVKVSTSAVYSFAASASRTLVANFAPQLALLQATTTSLVISWPGPLPGYVLQESPALGNAATWIDCTNAVEIVGGASRVTVKPAGTCFYRLSRP